MLPISENDIRASFVNASLRERKALIPPDLSVVDWDETDYLGWRDSKLSRVGYVVIPVDDDLIGILLQEASRQPRTRAQCAWCEDVTLPNDLSFFSAKRAGAAGRRGDTVGTLVCTHFECSVNARRLPPPAYTGFDREAARDRRIATLREKTASFARDLRGAHR